MKVKEQIHFNIVRVLFLSGHIFVIKVIHITRRELVFRAMIYFFYKDQRSKLLHAGILEWIDNLFL